MIAGAVLAALFAAGAAAAEGPPAPPASAEPLPASDKERAAQAMVLHDEARELYAHGQYRAAIDKLTAALRLDPQGKELVYNLALIHERLAEVDVAERYYARYLEMETSPKERERIQAILQRLEGAKRELLPKRSASASAPKPSPAPPPPRAVPAPPPGPWVLVTGGVAAASFFTGVVLGVSAVARHPGAGATTGPGVGVDDLREDARAAHRQAVLADIAFLVGAASAGAALYLRYVYYPAHPRKSAPPARAGVGVDLALAPGAGSLRVRF